MLLEKVELENDGTELQVGPGNAGGQDPVVSVAPDGIAASQALVLLVLVQEGGNLRQVIVRHFPQELVLEADMVRKSEPVENDGDKVPEMGHYLRVMVSLVGQIQIPVKV